MSQNSAFKRLHLSIQDELYRMKWTTLRPIQVDAIHAIFDEKSHLIISAMTSGGKTEAAFLPILSDIVDDHERGIRALYVGPLKALINDQFRRLELMCEHADIPVYRWHGDVGQSTKNRMFKNPGGVLLITPESIESLFLNHTDKLKRLFANLSYIVVDELHAFIGTERGAHLRSLISRLMYLTKNPVRIIGLSATLGDMELAKHWVDGQNPDEVMLIKSEERKDIELLIKGYRIDDTEECQLAQDIIDTFAGRTALIFANSKRKLEGFADITDRILMRAKQPNPFRIHHGSLSKSEREDTEDALRSSIPTATFCSSTLELGIDVGNVSAVGQIEAPWSVSSLKQRIGRSGRRDNEPSFMYMYIPEDNASNKTCSVIDRLYPELLRGIAIAELMFEGWCEPPDMGHWHLSTMIQQIMSLIAEYGGSDALSLYKELITQGAFGNIDKVIFSQTLRSMAANDLIEQIADGTLILGIKGESIVRRFDFYSAFTTPKEIRVIHHGHLIGTLPRYPNISKDRFLNFAGKRWIILDIDYDREEILVEPSEGRRLPTFIRSTSEIHPRVHMKMRKVLMDTSIPEYLDDTAISMLDEARAFARESDILRMPFFSDGSDTIWFTWCGTRTNRTLYGLGLYNGLRIDDEDFALNFHVKSYCDIISIYDNFLRDCPDVIEIALLFPLKAVEKYDYYLTDELLDKAYSHNYLDIPSALNIIKGLHP